VERAVGNYEREATNQGTTRQSPSETTRGRRHTSPDVPSQVRLQEGKIAGSEVGGPLRREGNFHRPGGRKRSQQPKLHSQRGDRRRKAARPGQHEAERT
jgi:hypothetical protein